jgi:hypothetical protein
MNSELDLFSVVICKGYTNSSGYKSGCRCDNCRRLKAEEAAREKEEVRQMINEIKRNTVCCDCGAGKDKPGILVFHHTVVCPKNRKLSSCPNKYALKRELKKGVFVCWNCHADRHTDKETGKVDYANINFR